jgi:hypothetical protein
MKTYNLLVLFRPGYLRPDLIYSYLRQVTARTPNKTSELLVTLMQSFFTYKVRAEAEFMNILFSWDFLGIILRVIRLEVSIYNIYITN